MVASDSPDALAADIAKYGVAKVIALAHPGAEELSRRCARAGAANLVKATGAEYVLATATAIGKDLMPRLAARMKAPMASEISSIGDDGTCVRPMYAGNAMATVELDGPVKVITVRGTAFDAAKPADAASPVEKSTAEIDAASRQDGVRLLQPDQERSSAAHRGAHRRVGWTRPQIGRELQDRARAAGR